MSNALDAYPSIVKGKRNQGLARYYFKQNRSAYVMIIVPLIVYVAFKYVPMFGVIIGFQDYNPWLGFAESPFVGLKHFRDFVTGPYFVRLMLNTLFLNVLILVFAYPAAILFALLLNELRVGAFKRVSQTISYLPHFISTVVVVGILKEMFAYSGIVNQFLGLFGAEAIPFFSVSAAFRPLYVGSDIWQDVGWDSIIYLAAIAGINPELYEAATIDGATRFQKARFITIAGILPTMVILFVLKSGDMLSIGFEKVFLMQNPSIYDVADVIPTYIYRRGIQDLNYSYATAVGMFNAVLSMILLISTNKIAKTVTETSLW